jgi:hypothetical protein
MSSIFPQILNSTYTWRDFHLWPGSPGFEPASLHCKGKAARKHPRGPPQTPPRVGAICTGYALKLNVYMERRKDNLVGRLDQLK